MSEVIVDGKTVQYESGRTWLSSDGRSRTLAFDASAGQEQLIHALVFDRKPAVKSR